MSKQLVLTRGLPASGKTTWARGWVAEDPTSRARVNRDDLRQLLYGRDAPLERELESAVTSAQRAAVTGLLAAGKSVVVDDMHLRRSYIVEWKKVATANGAELVVEERFWQVSVEECVLRDFNRMRASRRYVGTEVIRELALRYAKIEPWRSTLHEVTDGGEEYVYVPDADKPTAWLVDVDGTLAHMSDRGPFDWHRVGEDTVNWRVAEVVDNLHDAGHQIIIMSGRDEVCRQATVAWLDSYFIPRDRLLMRPEGDRRKDSVVKLELFKECVAPHYYVCGVLDDRDQVVEMWRSIGLLCLQVAPGAF